VKEFTDSAESVVCASLHLVFSSRPRDRSRSRCLSAV